MNGMICNGMTAWMLGNNGIAIPVNYHPYITEDNLELSLFSAEWLYRNAGDMTHKGTAMQFLYEWALRTGMHEEIFLQWVETEIFGKPESELDFPWYPAMPTGLSSRELAKHLIQNPVRNPLAAELVLEKLTKCIAAVLSDVPSGKQPLYKLEEIPFFAEIQEELNQYFLRIRYGEICDTADVSKEMVFQISSICFDWYHLILETLRTSPYEVETVTIIRDSGVADNETAYYKAYDGKRLYKQMPVKSFYEEEENPANRLNHLYYRNELTPEAAGDIQYIRKALAAGNSISSLVKRYSGQYDYLMKEFMRERIRETLAAGKTIYDAKLLCNDLAECNLLLAELKERERTICRYQFIPERR